MTAPVGRRVTTNTNASSTPVTLASFSTRKCRQLHDPIRINPRHHPRALSDRQPAWQWRDGCRLPGQRPPPQAHGGDQAPPATASLRPLPATGVSEGKPVSAIVVVLRDITEGQRVERALQESQARYENLYQDAPDMLASVAVDTELIVQCNQTLVRATGYRRDELLGRPMRDLQAALDQVHAHGQVRDCELQVRCKNGSTIEVSLRIAAIRDEKGDLYFRSTWRDITVRKRVQTVLDLKQAELARSRLELQALAGRLFTAQEDERRRISRELHDDLDQRLAMLTLDIDGLSHRLPRSRQVTVERLQTLRDSIVELSDAVHTLAYKLHVSVLEDLGLNVALESYLADFQRREAVQVDLRQEQLVGPVPPEVAGYRS